MARPKLETSMLHRRIIIPVIPHPELTALKFRAQAAGNRSLRNSHHFRIKFLSCELPSVIMPTSLLYREAADTNKILINRVVYQGS